MTPEERYRRYLGGHGGRASAAIREHDFPAVGGFRAFSSDTASGDGFRALASVDALVSADRDGAGDWRALLETGDAVGVAGAIAWLWSERPVSPHGPGRSLSLLLPGVSPERALDPAVSALLAAPGMRRERDGLLVLTAWYAPDRGGPPLRVRVLAPPVGTATVEIRDATSLLPEDDDPRRRAVTALRSTSPRQREWALGWLARHDAGAAVSAAAAALEDADADLRTAALELLAASGEARARTAVERHARDAASAGARGECTAALARFGAAAVSALAEIALGDADGGVRLQAVHALAGVDATTAATALAGVAAGSADRRVRHLAAQYLATRASPPPEDGSGEAQ